MACDRRHRLPSLVRDNNAMRYRENAEDRTEFSNVPPITLNCWLISTVTSPRPGRVGCRCIQVSLAGCWTRVRVRVLSAENLRWMC